MKRIGIDLGGTKIEGICLDDGGREVARRRMATPRTYDGTVQAIVTLVHQLEHESRDSATVGVGIPGAVTPTTGLVKNANSTWLIGQPLQADLQSQLARPIRIMNDANCFAISEAADGAAAGADVVFGVILGTGVGGGIVVRGLALDGANLIAGEWGHNPLPWMTPDESPGAPCYCGKRGCVETFLSGPGFERDFAHITGHARTSREIVAAAAADAQAADALVRYHDRLARALATVINLLDPHVIVLGGGMSNLPTLAEHVSERLPRYVFSDAVITKVVRNAHGDSSGVRGAAWLWPAGGGS
ncbi:MAG: ROK family protein [Gemmatimonadaceae bacterium]